MPIYEYRCAACGHHHEALQKMSDGPLRKCPECGQLRLRRLVSASRFRLKGSGWYETDFKSDGETKRNLLEHATGEAADGKDKTDAKKEAGSSEAATSTTTEKPAAKPKQPASKGAAPKKPSKARADKSARP